MSTAEHEFGDTLNIHALQDSDATSHENTSDREPTMTTQFNNFILVLQYLPA